MKHKGVVRKIRNDTWGFPWLFQCYSCTGYIYAKNCETAIKFALRHYNKYSKHK